MDSHSYKPNGLHLIDNHADDTDVEDNDDQFCEETDFSQHADNSCRQHSKEYSKHHSSDAKNKDASLLENGQSMSPKDGKGVTKAQNTSSNQQEITPHSNIYIRNIPPSWTVRDLSECFSRFGEVRSIHILTEPITKRSKCVGFVRYSTSKQAKRAVELANGMAVSGGTRSLLVRYADVKTKSEKDAKRNQKKVQYVQQVLSANAAGPVSSGPISNPNALYPGPLSNAPMLSNSAGGYPTHHLQDPMVDNMAGRSQFHPHAHASMHSMSSGGGHDPAFYGYVAPPPQQPPPPPMSGIPMPPPSNVNSLPHPAFGANGDGMVPHHQHHAHEASYPVPHKSYSHHHQTGFQQVDGFHQHPGETSGQALSSVVATMPPAPSDQRPTVLSLLNEANLSTQTQHYHGHQQQSKDTSPYGSDRSGQYANGTPAPSTSSGGSTDVSRRDISPSSLQEVNPDKNLAIVSTAMGNRPPSSRGSSGKSDENRGKLSATAFDMRRPTSVAQHSQSTYHHHHHHQQQRPSTVYVTNLVSIDVSLLLPTFSMCGFIISMHSESTTSPQHFSLPNSLSSSSVYITYQDRSCALKAISRFNKATLPYSDGACHVAMYVNEALPSTALCIYQQQPQPSLFTGQMPLMASGMPPVGNGGGAAQIHGVNQSMNSLYATHQQPPMEPIAMAPPPPKPLGGQQSLYSQQQQQFQYPPQTTSFGVSKHQGRTHYRDPVYTSAPQQGMLQPFQDQHKLLPMEHTHQAAMANDSMIQQYMDQHQQLPLGGGGFMPEFMPSTAHPMASLLPPPPSAAAAAAGSQQLQPGGGSQGLMQPYPQHHPHGQTAHPVGSDINDLQSIFDSLAISPESLLYSNYPLKGGVGLSTNSNLGPQPQTKYAPQQPGNHLAATSAVPFPPTGVDLLEPSAFYDQTYSSNYLLFPAPQPQRQPQPPQ